MAALSSCERLRVALYGAVQGVGFRPFVYRLATEMGLHGWVLNSAAGLTVEVDGPHERLQEFLLRLDKEKPRAAVVLARETSVLAPGNFTRFEIVPSDGLAEKTAGILPDLATCPKCLEELLDPANRRHAYLFTKGAAPGWIAARFHNALAEWILATARRAGVSQVALSGGVFQNSYLVDRTVFLLEREGYSIYTHQHIPANDGGIALGQAVMSAGPRHAQPEPTEEAALCV